MRETIPACSAGLRATWSADSPSARGPCGPPASCQHDGRRIGRIKRYSPATPAIRKLLSGHIDLRSREREPPYGFQEFLRLNWLPQAGVRLELVCLLFRRAVTGHDDYRCVCETACAELYQELLAVQPRHH